MRYEWDEEKRAANLAKHGLDFADVERGFDWHTSIAIDPDVIDSEVRERDLGLLQGRVVLLVWSDRDDSVRIISLRPATPGERRFYVKYS